jgi:hypothetical protein
MFGMALLCDMITSSNVTLSLLFDKQQKKIFKKYVVKYKI